MIKKYFLTILLVSFSLKGIAQSNYLVSSIPFQQYTGQLPVQGTLDDKYSNAITLPFNFDFYGNVYNQIVVSTNGYIDFRSNLQNTNAPWSFSQAIPNVSFPVKNAVLGCFHDLNNDNAQGTLTYGTYGAAPYRKFVVIFDNHSHFSDLNKKSSFQMILYESSNVVDVQIVNKQVAPGWNGGRAVTGLINDTGAIGIAAPGRNTGAWTAYHEGWRFARPGYYANYSFVKCDADNNGSETFNLQVAQNDLSPLNPSGVSFYQTESDSQTSSNPLPLSYTNVSNPETIYANSNGQTKKIVLSLTDCSVDNDSDNVAATLEDINNDSNLANDDTDSDGLPNYLDNDDDGDLVLTSAEYVFSARNVNALLDTDGDGILDYLDNDDDGDGTLTFKEDYNNNGNLGDDDLNTNGVPDYLDHLVTSLGVENHEIGDSQIILYPNPATSVLNIENKSSEAILDITVYAVNGVLVKQVKSKNDLTPIFVNDLQSGIYFVKVKTDNHVLNYKFIKK